jgi:hypothetical protein
MKRLLTALVAVASAFGITAFAHEGTRDSNEIRAMREELQALKAAYELRIGALEAQLHLLRRASGAAPTSAVPPTSAGKDSAAPAVAEAVATPFGQLPNKGSTQADNLASRPLATNSPGTRRPGSADNAFNPQISLILSGAYGRSSRQPDDYRISGVPLPAGLEAGPGFRGFSLGETELGLVGNIDPWSRGVVHFAVETDNSIGVEEAYFQTTRLGNGMGLKAGRFYSGVGYLNQQHRHYWDFIDAPLAYQALLGGQLGDDGLQLRWLAPAELMVEIGAELGRGRAFPGSELSRNAAGMGALYAHLGGDLGESHSWRAGLSFLRARADDQSFELDAAADASARFTGSTRLLIADFVWKWMPNGDSRRTSFKLQGEYIHARRDGDLAFNEAAGTVSASQSGWYLQALYQFMPRWRAGVRADQIDPGVWGALLTPQDGSYRPRRASAILEFSPSEFSRFRLQFAQDRPRHDLVDNQLQLQYQMLLGSHPAHPY